MGGLGGVGRVGWVGNIPTTFIQLTVAGSTNVINIYKTKYIQYDDQTVQHTIIIITGRDIVGGKSVGI